MKVLDCNKWRRPSGIFPMYMCTYTQQRDDRIELELSCTKLCGPAISYRLPGHILPELQPLDLRAQAGLEGQSVLKVARVVFLHHVVCLVQRETLRHVSLPCLVQLALMAMDFATPSFLQWTSVRRIILEFNDYKA
jgi:hypothetical protein